MKGTGYGYALLIGILVAGCGGGTPKCPPTQVIVPPGTTVFASGVTVGPAMTIANELAVPVDIIIGGKSVKEGLQPGGVFSAPTIAQVLVRDTNGRFGCVPGRENVILRDTIFKPGRGC